MKKNILLTCFCISILYAKSQSVEAEPHRPQFHFSPKEKWMNDPNGMIYVKGVYHLYYQHNPSASVWGPMHWGHATSKDMLNWQHQPVALYPDSLGYIFSGSAVIDANNTAGFGKDAMVAIFTYDFAQASEAFAAANVPFICLTNYPSLISLAVEKGYVTKEQENILLDWRNSPSTWTGK